MLIITNMNILFKVYTNRITSIDITIKCYIKSYKKKIQSYNKNIIYFKNNY